MGRGTKGGPRSGSGGEPPPPPGRSRYGPRPVKPPTRIGNVDLRERLFEILPSTYFRGTHRMLGNDVVVRRLPLPRGHEEETREAFFRAQRHAASLLHPSILRPVDVVEQAGVLWGIYEFRTYLPSRTIVERGGPAPLADTARVAAQIADALSFMHCRDVVHGRVAPREVGVTPDGLGFLLSVSKSADLAAGIWPLRPEVLGLSPFSAPEEFAGARPTASSDTHSLAASIFWWLTGRYPRGGEDEGDAIERASRGVAVPDIRELRPEVPDSLAEALAAALQPDPERRRGSCAALGSLLDEIHRRLAAEVPAGFETGAYVPVIGKGEKLQILGHHGGGAFGVVFKARGSDTGATLAVKALKPEHGADHEAHQRFIREAEAIRNIHHENVVRVRGVGELGGTPFVAMDFVPGQTLASLLLREGTLEPRRAAHLAEGIARGLGAIHEQGIVHRDVQPRNLLVRPDDVVVISDFGTARDPSTPRRTLTGQLAGTPAYVAPELLADEEPRPAADLYALGSILYEMLAGLPPFAGRDTSGTIRAIRDEPPPDLPDDVPEELARIVSRLLAKRPAERYADAETVAQALAAVRCSLAGEDAGEEKQRRLDDAR